MLDRFEAFVTGITVCYKYIQRIKTTEMTEFGLKGTHVMCLYYLHKNPEGLTAAQLCRLCEEDKAAISRTISELEKRGYLAPCSKEKKYRSLITLTEAGEQTARQMDRIIESWVAVGGEGLTEQERMDFYSALERIAANLKEKMDRS